MFLSSWKTVRSRNDRGSALIAVIGVMAVGAIIAVTLTAASLNALGVTTSTRASVQSRAAADAGIDVAVSQLRATNGCTADATGRLTFTAVGNVDISDIIIKPDNKNGCPDGDTSSLTITSTGVAQAPGVAGASHGDKTTVQVSYSYEDIITQVPLAGVAVYAYTVDGVLKKFQLSSADNSVATSVMIKTGDIECTNGARIGGDLTLGDGSAVLDMCDVAGSIHASKNVSVNKSNIGHDVVAGQLATVTNSTVGGTVQSGPAASAPPVPDWVDVDFDAVQWAARGYTVVDWSGPCAITKSTSAWSALANYTTPTVVNFLTACPSTAVTTSNSMDTVALKTDIVFVGQQFTVNKLYFTAASKHNLTFMVPDKVPDSMPTCAPPAGLTGNITLTNETNFGTNLAAMIYTPCRIYSDRDGFRGQMYGGQVTFMQQATLTFVPVGISGVDLSPGVTVPQVTGAKLGVLQSRRELVGGG